MREKRSLKKLWKHYGDMTAGKNRFSKSVLWIFAVVAAGLLWCAKKIHLSYNAINVLVYYWLIPATWTLMIDWKIDCQINTPLYEGFFPMLTIFLCAGWIGILLATAMFFEKWSDLVFNLSVVFLNYFNRWGGNYELNSVIICVAIPIIIYIILIMILVL